MDKIIALIERNPSLNKNTPQADLKLMNVYHEELFGVKISDMGCHPCVLKGLNRLRSHCGYEPIALKESKNITKARLKICYTCPHFVRNGLFGFVDKCNLCGCSVRAKAELRKKLLKLLGGCPDKRWDV